MCECKSCENYKEKKIEPKVGDRIKCGRMDTTEGVIVAMPPLYHPTSGTKHMIDILVFIEGYETLQLINRFTVID